MSLRWICLGSEEDFDDLFTRMAGANGSLSASDKEILGWFSQHRDVKLLMPERIPQKETLAYLVSILSNPTTLLPAVKTATDVLRIATAPIRGRCVTG